MSNVRDYPIDEDLAIGLDIGIGSVGSAVASRDAVLFAGSRCFDVPEEPKTRELKNKTRREKRGQRRVTRRRRQRLAAIRDLLLRNGLLESIDVAKEGQRDRATPDPWQARAAGLDRSLTTEELAATLIHIAKHRGFLSNRKDSGNQEAPDDDKKMLAAINTNKELSGRYRTVGEMVAKDARFAISKRNRGGDYAHTLARNDLKAEVATLFAAQRRHANTEASETLECAYLDIAFYQRPLQDSEDMVGDCPFEPSEKRSARHAPSFEKFRLLSKLNTVKIIEADNSLRRLKVAELAAALDDFGAQKSITWKTLETKLGFRDGCRFEGIDETKAKKDVCAAAGASRGTATIREVVGAAGWNTLRHQEATLDDIVRVLSFRDDIASIQQGLGEIELEPLVLEALMKGVGDGKFSKFRGAGHVSAKVARTLLPPLLDGKVYSEACASVGYDHAQARKVTIEDIRNPVVQRCLREACKQFEVLVREFGVRPGRVVVELARPVGKSAEDRNEMTKGIEKRTAEKERHRADMQELLGLDSEPDAEDLLRYELWKEQGYRCIYTDREIAPEDIRADRNQVQVDHVLPRSRSQDNSYTNKVLCLTQANQDKGQHTPWEWKVENEGDDEWWREFEARVRALQIKRFKQNTLLMRNFRDRENVFSERNLNETKYAARATLAALREYYSDEPDPNAEGYLSRKRRLFARPGTVTAQLRRAWGLEGIKNRAEDRHHALDALICAVGSEATLQRLTREYQALEREGRARWTPNVRPPWPDFRNNAIAAIESVFVSRSEKRRGRGAGHDATIYAVGVDEDGGEITYERKAVAKLEKRDLERVKDPERNRALITSLEAWIEAGKPRDVPPLSPKGDPIRKVALRRGPKAGMKLNEGHVDNANMVRVDVFAKEGRFYLVPIYTHQVMNKAKWPTPPNRAIKPKAPESEWPIIDERFEFCFSLYPDCYIEIVKGNGELIEGYYRSTDRANGAFTVSTHNLRLPLIRGIGARTLHSFRKFQIDRLGRRHEIVRETRTWHGVACT